MVLNVYKMIATCCVAGIGSTIDGLSEAGDKLAAPVRGRIELKDVRFSYPTRPDAQVLSCW